MIQKIEVLYEKLSFKLKEVEDGHYPGELEQRKEVIRYCNECLKELKLIVLDHEFDRKEDEIRFFRELKPLFVSPLLANIMISNIQLRKPIGSIKALKRYYKKELELISSFFDRHSEYYHYLRSDSTEMDEKWFVRANVNCSVFPVPNLIDIDPRFSTGTDYIISLIKANEELKEYLIKRLSELGRSGRTQLSEVKKYLRWTGPKVHLIELAYALVATGQINNGGIEVSAIARAFESFFNIKLGVIYHPFQEIRLRKRESRTKYIDMMKEGLLKRMDDLDV